MKPAAAPKRAVGNHVTRAGCVYALWVVIHHGAANLYPTHCAPLGWAGLLASTIYAPSPQCVALRWCITRGAEALNTMWVVAATWCASHLIVPS
jgi:hypothetical protein